MLSPAEQEKIINREFEFIRKIAETREEKRKLFRELMEDVGIDDPAVMRELWVGLCEHDELKGTRFDVAACGRRFGESKSA